MALAANASLTAANTSSNKVIGETSQGIVKDPAYSNKTSQQRKVGQRISSSISI